MHAGDETDSLITFAGFGKKTGSTGSGASASDAGLRNTPAAAAATVSDTCLAGVLCC